MLELGKTGALSGLFIIFLLIMSVLVIAFIVFVEELRGGYLFNILKDRLV